MYQNVRAFMLFILTYWYLKSVDPFKSCDGFFKDLQNRRFCEKFWVNRLFWIAKIILSKFFVRGTKYTKMFGSSCSLFWHIDIENLLIRLKAVMVSLKTSETEDFYHKIGKSIFFNNKELCGEKSLWQSFENQKSESTVLLHFPLAFSWCTPFFLGILFSWWNLQNKMATFWLFGKNWKKPILNVKFLNQNCIK